MLDLGHGGVVRTLGWNVIGVVRATILLMLLLSLLLNKRRCDWPSYSWFLPFWRSA